MFDIDLQRTQIERTGDNTRPVQFNRTVEHERRIQAHCERVQREYFDSGLYEKEKNEHYAKLPSGYRDLAESIRKMDG